ncbi:MAG: thioredoxin domain-containing protein [Nitrospiraceae bacterium]|nr:thioredoxin domain-containing protein [Nitrospiraceae bacterium]
MNATRVVSGLQKRLWILPVLCILTIIIGQLCAAKCAYIQGDILGIDLNIFGILFYSLLLVSLLVYRNFYTKDWLIKVIAAVVAVGVGAELILIKFQVENSVYCPKCLISGFFFLVLFFLLARHLGKWVIILLIVAGLLFTSFTFNGSVIPSYADEAYPQFGADKAAIELIVYSDYFCLYCRRIDQQTNIILSKIKKRARILFVDVPLHPQSLDYSEIFLYTWFVSGNNLENAFLVRELLFDLAAKKTDQTRVIALLKSKGIQLSIDRERARSIFRRFYNESIKTDKVSATPTVVIVRGGERKKYVGAKAVLKALEELLST